MEKRSGMADVDKFVPGTVKILFSTYLPCENITAVTVPTYPRVLVVSHSSTSCAGVFYPITHCKSSTCVLHRCQPSLHHTADAFDLTCVHFANVPHRTVLLDEALPKGTPTLMARWGNWAQL